jgi:hypothetical protein
MRRLSRAVNAATQVMIPRPAKISVSSWKFRSAQSVGLSLGAVIRDDITGTSRNDTYCATLAHK